MFRSSWIVAAVGGVLVLVVGGLWLFRPPALILHESFEGGPAEIPTLVAYRNGEVVVEDHAKLKPRFYRERLTPHELTKFLAALDHAEAGPRTVYKLDDRVEAGTVSLFVRSPSRHFAVQIDGFRTVPGWRNRTAYVGFSMSDYDKQAQLLKAESGPALVDLLEVIPLLKLSRSGVDDPFAWAILALNAQTPRQH